MSNCKLPPTHRHVSLSGWSFRQPPTEPQLLPLSWLVVLFQQLLPWIQDWNGAMPDAVAFKLCVFWASYSTSLSFGFSYVKCCED